MSDFHINPVSHQSGGAPRLAVSITTLPTGTGHFEPAPILEEFGLANFNERAGVNRFVRRSVEHLQLQQRRLTQATRLSQPNVNKDAVRSDDDDPRLRSASLGAVQTLQSDGRSALEDQLEHAYDVLERHTLLRSARAEVEQADLDPAEKAGLKDTLADMLGDLMDLHGDVIRSGLKAAASFESAVGAMASLSQVDTKQDQADSIRALRAQFGAKSDTKVDAPLTPYELAASLQSKFGVDNFSAALGGLRSKMSGEFRSKPAGVAGPRLWLSLSDAAAFNAVQSSFAIAGDLRRDLSERVGITPVLHQAGTSLALLNTAQTGASTANVVVSRIVGEKDLAGLPKAQVYMAMKNAINQMPITLWPLDLLPNRTALLDHCRSLAIDATGATMSDHGDETGIAKQLRLRIQRKKPRDERSDDGEEDSTDEKSYTPTLMTDGDQAALERG